MSNTDKTACEKLFFESIKEHRGIYFVEYQPPKADQNFAILWLVFLEATEPRHVAELMQLELRHWLGRYPVALMVSAFDVSENLIPVNDGENIHLVGWVGPTGEMNCSWKLDDLTEFLKTASRPSDWRIIYNDVPFKTGAQVKVAADEHMQERRRQIFTLKVVLTIWLAVAPAAWAIVQYFGPEWLALIVLIYSLWQAWRTWMKITGRGKLSRLELEKSERQRKMEHYYYHCELNPDGFSKLKAENFDRDISADIRKEAAKLAGTKTSSTTPGGGDAKSSRPRRTA